MYELNNKIDELKNELDDLDIFKALLSADKSEWLK